MLIYCPKCKIEKDISLFPPNKSKPNGVQTYCKECQKEYINKYNSKYNKRDDVMEKNRMYSRLRYKNDEEYKKRMKDWRQNELERIWDLILNHYGNKCSCKKCPETNPTFLTIDHINNDGYKDKDKNGTRFVGIRLYKKIVRDGFPDYYRLRCWNCNSGRYHNNGICPHDEPSIHRSLFIS